MIEFKDITLADKELIQSFTLNSQRRNCDLSFANLCSWTFLYQTKYAVLDFRRCACARISALSPSARRYCP